MTPSIRRRPAALALAVALLAAPAAATSTFDDSVTPGSDLLFGLDNANGGFTVNRVDGIEVGLRGKLRYNAAGRPENTFNSDGAGGYGFDPVDGVPAAGRSIFNFEWSVNVDVDGRSGRTLDDFLYRLVIDYDPTERVGSLAGGDAVIFDPINLPLADHGLGGNATPSPTVSRQYVASDAGGLLGSNYAVAIGLFNVAQNSWNLGFFNPPGVDPQTEGLFTIQLGVYDRAAPGTALAATAVEIRYGEVPAAVPVPAALPLMALGLGALGWAGRRRRKAA